MKNQNSNPIIKTKKVLSLKEQKKYSAGLEHLLKMDGIISIFLEKETLHVRYDPGSLHQDLLKLLQAETDVPIKRIVIQPY